MKLYARLTNDKGKQAGLGGTEYLDIDITVGNDVLAQLTIRMADYLGADVYGLFDGKDKMLAYLPALTKKKGEGNIKCECGQWFYGLEGKEDTCSKCLKPFIQGEKKKGKS